MTLNGLTFRRSVADDLFVFDDFMNPKFKEMDKTMGERPFRRRLGKFLLAGWVRVAGRLRSFWWRTVYRFAWKIGPGTQMAGGIRRRSLGGDAFFGRQCDLGHNLVIDVATNGLLTVGDHVSINAGTFISVRERVEIGDDCRIGEYCSIRDNDHVFASRDAPIRTQGMTSQPVQIGPGAWLGRNVTVQPGVTIGEGAIIGANAFVNRDIPPYAIAVGTPARVTRDRPQ